MWKNFVKDYLSFSKGERRAVLVLLALILLVFVLPYWWPAHKNTAAVTALPPRQPPAAGAAPGNAYARHNDISDKEPINKPRLFYFDPNTLAADGWQQLGLRDKTIGTILHYREKGGFFRRPEDIGRIYGLLPAEYARLLPWVKIAQPAYTAVKENDRSTAPHALPPYRRYSDAWPAKPPLPRNIDINTADTTAFIALPGIGSRLANRIINFRNRLGGFYSVEQVGETYALPDSVFLQIKSRLLCDSHAIRRININTADVNTLKQHPYMRWNIASAIVAYRAQHGDYTSVEGLQRIEIISPEDFRRLRPYLYVP